MNGRGYRTARARDKSSAGGGGSQKPRTNSRSQSGTATTITMDRDPVTGRFDVMSNITQSANAPPAVINNNSVFRGAKIEVNPAKFARAAAALNRAEQALELWAIARAAWNKWRNSQWWQDQFKMPQFVFDQACIYETRNSWRGLVTAGAAANCLSSQAQFWDSWAKINGLNSINANDRFAHQGERHIVAGQPRHRDGARYRVPGQRRPWRPQTLAPDRRDPFKVWPHPNVPAEQPIGVDSPVPAHVPFTQVPGWDRLPTVITGRTVGPPPTVTPTKPGSPDNPLPPSRRKPPGGRTKEKKAFIRSVAAKLLKGAHVVTELMDLEEAIYGALDPKCRKAHGDTGAAITPQKKASIIYACWETADVNKLVFNLIWNHFSDQLIGKLSGRWDDFGRKIGVRWGDVGSDFRVDPPGSREPEWSDDNIPLAAIKKALFQKWNQGIDVWSEYVLPLWG